MAEILGIDEVGRGCLAGPLVVGAVILDDSHYIEGLRDSKQVARPMRERLAEQIELHAKAYSLGWVSAKEIDKIGLTKAMTLAIEKALEHIDAPYDQIIIDGSVNYLPFNPKSKAVIKADQNIRPVSAASIIAKVARDNYMIRMAETYPEYGFDSHVGYGTKDHIDMIKLHEPCKLHRLSFRPINSMDFSTAA